MNSRIIQKVTFGVSTVGNMQGLLLCLQSVLNGTKLPAKIQIRFEGEFPGFANYYLEQLAEIARTNDVDFSLHVAKPQGIRKSRQWHLDTAVTDYLFMGDDDVVFDPDALEVFWEAAQKVVSFGFLVGNKFDVNNRRGYKDYSSDIISKIGENAHTNLNYNKQLLRGVVERVVALDTGFCLLNALSLRYSGVRFDYFEKSFNGGGEDNFFGMLATKHGYLGYFVPSAQAKHLEKEKLNFSELDSRAEAILRSADAAGISDGVLELQVFPALQMK